MDRYFAIFKPTAKIIEVEFPDLIGCVTFGKNWDEAIDNAADVLAAWLVNAEPRFMKSPSSHKKLEKMLKGKAQLIPITVNPSIVKSYQELKRFNVIFPAATLSSVDTYRKKLGLKRSKILQIAVEEYMHKHPLD